MGNGADLSFRRLSGENCGDGFAAEARGQVLREERIRLRSRHGFLYVVAMIIIRRSQSDERGGKFHFRIIATLLNGSFHPAVSIHSCRGIRLILSPSTVCTIQPDSRNRTKPARRERLREPLWPGLAGGSAVLLPTAGLAGRTVLRGAGFPFAPARLGSNRGSQAWVRGGSRSSPNSKFRALIARR